MHKEHPLMQQLLAHMAAGDYTAGAALLKQVEKQIQQEADEAALQPELGIVRSSLYMAAGDFGTAEQEIQNSLKYDNNQYELYFSLGLCYEQTGRTEAAYYAYRLAVFLGRQTGDEALMQQQFEALCKSAGANAYALGQACQQMVQERLMLGEYQKTFEFLGEQLYDRNRIAAGVVLTEENMLLYMLLEMTLCEQKNMPPIQFQKENSCVRYHGRAEKFKPVYCRTKLLLRRIWFGAPVAQQRELNDWIKQEKLNADQLVVIAKYSVREAFWQDLFARLSAIVQYAHPEIGMAVSRYCSWLKKSDIGGAQKCAAPQETDNHAAVYRLDYQTGNMVCEAEGAEGRAYETAVIFCANDELYCAECIRYLRRLTVPFNKGLQIISVWHAPGMAAGYNAAMERIPSKYKIYIHQDTFIIEPNLLVSLTEAFNMYPDYGLLGIAGTRKLNGAAKWWQSPPEDLRMNLYQDAVLDILKSVSICSSGMVEPAAAMDGILLAAQADVRWREELYDGWHFYDIAQCRAFEAKGWQIGVLNAGRPVVMHETTMKKDAANLYDRYREIFIKEALCE